MSRSRAAGEPGEHAVGGPLHGATSDQWTDGDAGNPAPLERGPDLADGEDRPDADVRVARGDHQEVRVLERLQHPRGRPRRLGALEAHCVHLVAMLSADEPLLEGKLAGRRPDPGAQTVVGRGQDRRPDAQSRRKPRRHRRERLAARERLGANEVQADVAVAEPEPALPAEPRSLLERVPRLVRAPPAALVVPDPGEPVEHAVEVGGDVEAEHLEVVPDVADHGQLDGRDDLDEPAQKARSADAPRENDRLPHSHRH